MPDDDPGERQLEPDGPAAEEDDFAEQGGFAQEAEELPRRPRNRLLTPLPVALFVVLMTACGFIGGVLVEKGEGSGSGSSASAATGSGLASRFAALRAAAGGSTGGAGATGGARALGGGGATVGQVAFIHGGTLYVTTSEGNTVKVSTSAGSAVTKTVKSNVKQIHPGETVIVTGSKGEDGAVAAESIRVSEGGEGAGLGALFGAGGSPAGGGTGSRGAGNGGGGAGGQALFGSGGG